MKIRVYILITYNFVTILIYLSNNSANRGNS